LMNVFVTTFGISGGVHGSVFGGAVSQLSTVTFGISGGVHGSVFGGAVSQLSTMSPTSLPPSSTLLPQSTGTSSTTSVSGGLLTNVTTSTLAL